MGYAESSYDLDDLYGKFLTLADKKGQVFDYDLEALAFFSQITKSRSTSSWSTSACRAAAR